MPATDGASQQATCILGLNYAQHLFIWTLRGLVIQRGACPVTVREFSDACGEDAGRVLAAVQTFFYMVGQSCRRPLSIGHLGYVGLTGDEMRLVALIAAAQAEEQPLFEAHLCWLIRTEFQTELESAAQSLATILAKRGLLLALDTPSPPEIAKDARRTPAMRLVS